MLLFIELYYCFLVWFIYLCVLDYLERFLHGLLVNGSSQMHELCLSIWHWLCLILSALFVIRLLIFTCLDFLIDVLLFFGFFAFSFCVLFTVS